MPRERPNIIGLKVNKLTVLEYLGDKYYLCVCDCGNLHKVRTDGLIGKTKAKGCRECANKQMSISHKKNRENDSAYRVKDLTGQVFQNITVIEHLGRSRYLCRCECGIEVILGGSHLRQKTRIQAFGCPECMAKARYIALSTRKQTRLQDLTGKVCGGYTVIRRVGSKSTGSSGINKPLWEVKCNTCGKIQELTSPVIKANKRGCCSHRGSNSVMWKNGITKLHDLIRHLPEYNSWRGLVFARDSRTCQDCGASGKNNINAHHLVYRSTILHLYNITTVEDALACELLWDVDNGITLCKDCHTSRHKGKPNNQKRELLKALAFLLKYYLKPQQGDLS